MQSREVEVDGLAGGDFVDFTLGANPDGTGGGVMDVLAVKGDVEAAVGFHVVVDFNVGGIPDVIVVGDFFGESLDAVPVILLVKFVGVAPDIEEVGVEAAFGEAQKFLGEGEEVSFIVVAGGTEAEPVLGNAEVHGGLNSAAIDDACGFEGIYGIVVKVAVGVGTATDDLAKHFFQQFSVF